MKKFIIKDYKNWLQEEELAHSLEKLDLYLNGLYYDLVDDLQVNRESFSVPKELTDRSAMEYIEGKIKDIIIKGVK